jgi:hypothetical protein
VEPFEPLERLDAVVVGASIRGLVAAYVLGRMGCRTVLIEKTRRAGGADSSFLTSQGTRFDHGLHVLDAGRSDITTRLFTHVVDGRVHQVTLKRGIALRNQVMPYAPSVEDMPDGLRRLLAAPPLVDEVGDELPTRQRLARHYGRGFADLVFDEVLLSYPSDARHLAFGVDEARLLTNIYPWFFPKATRKSGVGDESRVFHDQLRGGVEQRILYPQDGGFGGFAEGFLRHLDAARVEVIMAADDLHIEMAPGTHTVKWIGAHGRRFVAPHIFWGASWSVLCGLLGVPCQHTATDRVMLGSFRLDRAATTRYHEILVGDPLHHVNRIYFPAAFRESDDALMQIEFAVPRATAWPEDAAHWRESWLTSARSLGLLGDGHRVEEFDYRSFPMHFNGFGAEGEPLRDADPGLIRSDSNIRPLVPSMANLNLNRYVPRTIDYVAATMGRSVADVTQALC